MQKERVGIDRILLELDKYFTFYESKNYHPDYEHSARRKFKKYYITRGDFPMYDIIKKEKKLKFKKYNTNSYTKNS
jgi:hypothetical protein